MTPACSQLELHYTACSLHAPCTLYLPQATPVTISFELHCRGADRYEPRPREEGGVGEKERVSRSCSAALTLTLTLTLPSSRPSLANI